MNLINGLSKLFYWPICRAYTRHLGNKPADGLLRFLCSLQFWRVNHFWPDFLHPRRFSEKLISRQLHGRDPILTLISDKLGVRDYVTQKVGGECLVPLHWRGTDPAGIPFDELPQQYVLKTNHGCGQLIIVKDKASLDHEATRQQLKKWLSVNFCHDVFLGIAWAYRNIPPQLFVESFLEENGKVPTDYKFWCFHGRVECITLHIDRFADSYSTLGFNRNFEPGGLEFNLPTYKGIFKPPANHVAMVELAEVLAQDFEFIRVDLYNINGRIYFGELTPYPGGVSAQFKPDSLDYSLGEKWKN